MVKTTQSNFFVGLKIAMEGKHDVHVVNRSHCCLVNHRWFQAISDHWTVSWSSAVTCFQNWWCSRFLQDWFVATIDSLLKVRHATVADLDHVPVEDLVEHMIFRELFIEDLEEHTPNICSHILAERWVVPDDVLVAVSSGGVWRLCWVWCER